MNGSRFLIPLALLVVTGFLWALWGSLFYAAFIGTVFGLLPLAWTWSNPSGIKLSPKHLNFGRDLRLPLILFLLVWFIFAATGEIGYANLVPHSAGFLAWIEATGEGAVIGVVFLLLSLLGSYVDLRRF